MPLDQIRVDADDFPPIPMPCLRCGAETPMRFAGPCPTCTAELREKFQGAARDIGGTEYEPKMNVTPNAVAVKDD
jgi:hypothetical protein